MQSAFRSILVGALVIFTYLPVVHADFNKVKESLSARLEKLDSHLLSLSKSNELSSRRIEDATPPFRNSIKEFPEFQTLMRTNSKGKVVNEIVNEGRQGKKFRSVARQSWFGETARMNPYYGFLKMRDGTTYLFWCKPIPVGTREGGYRFGGALVAKIELSDVLKAVAGEVDEPFQLLHEDEAIYANEWNSIKEPVSEKITVKGLDNIVLRGKKASPPNVAAADTQVTQQSATAAAKDDAAAPSGKQEKDSGGFPWVTIILLIIVAGGGGFLIVTIRKSAKKRHAALLAEIEDGKPEKEDVGSSQKEASFDDGATVIMPVPRREMEQQKAMGRVAQQAAGRPFPASRVSGANTTVEEHRQQPLQSNPSQEMYNRIRQEVFHELKSKMDVQFKKQLHDAIAARSEKMKQQIFAQAQQSVSRNMQAYSSVLAQQIHTLSGLASQNIPEQSRRQALNSVLVELKRIHSSMSGRHQPNARAR